MKAKSIIVILVLALVLIVCQTKLCEAAPMGTAFTYQGHLYDASYPANDFYDLQFKLYDALVGGGQIGTDINTPDVDVIDGSFAVELDFGSGAFTGDARWLEIGVRPGELNDPNVYTILSPRQEVTPAPYTLYAESAGGASWNDLTDIPSGFADGEDDDVPDNDGEVPDNISINNGLLYALSGSSSVGIGTTSPQPAVKLEVRSSASSGAAVAAYATGDDNIAIFGMSSSNGVAAIQGNANGADYAGLFNGPIKITDGSQGAGKVLTSDASGLASWQSPSPVPGTHFWSCVGANFHPQYNTNSTKIDRDGAYIEAQANGMFFFAPVMLPHGANVTKVVVYGNAAATAEDWAFRKINLNSAAMSVIESAKIGTEVTCPGPRIIDNNTYAYLLWTASLDTGDVIYNAKITYTK